MRFDCKKRLEKRREVRWGKKRGFFHFLSHTSFHSFFLILLSSSKINSPFLLHHGDDLAHWLWVAFRSCLPFSLFHKFFGRSGKIWVFS